MELDGYAAGGGCHGCCRSAKAFALREHREPVALREHREPVALPLG